MQISEIEKQIRKYLKKEDRKDVEFRALIALTELGDVVKYITHDKKLNPNARPHGTKGDETLAYGQALIQTIASMILRGIDVEEALKISLKNWQEADWRNIIKKQNKILRNISGAIAYPGNAKGRAYIISGKYPIEKLPRGYMLVAESVRPSMAVFLSRAAGIITDQGGITSHAAIMAREQKIPCIVGMGNATKAIPMESSIEIFTRNGKGFVRLT